MYVSKSQILDALPKYVNKRVTITEDQGVKDIISTMLKAHKEFEPLYNKIGYLFIGGDLQETCDNLYDFCKENLKYKEEEEDLQTVNAPQVLVTLGHCDCKGYASFICGCLSAIERNTGKKIDWEYCFASYEMFQRVPYHVFCMVQEGNKSYWVDPTPGAAGKKVMWWYRKKVKTGNMALVKVVGKVNPPRGVVRGLGVVFPGEGQSVYQGAIPPTLDQQSTAAENALLSDSQPSLLAGGIQTTEDITPVPVSDAGTQAANGAAVPADDTNNLKKWLLAGALLSGLGGVYYFSKNGNKLGKKNKKDNSTPLILIGAAALGYYYFFMRPASVTETIDTGGVLTVQPPATGNDTPLGAITLSPEVTIPTEDTAVYNALYSYDSRFRYGIDRMSTAARRDLYQYFFGYLKKGLRLYNVPGFFSDGWYNPALYASIKSIDNTWHWGIIN